MNEDAMMELVERIKSRFYGKYRGTVTQVDADLVRIKAKVPAVHQTWETDWCMPCVPYAGNDAGIAFLPEVGSGVWIEFEGGDVSYPIWTGCFWRNNEVPSRVAAAVKVIKTHGGQQLVLDDDDHSVTITDANGNSVTLDRSGIALVRKSGKLVVTDGKVSANDGAMEVT
jgi:uncharacterized protein involved in type VI secretion and phage assembly